MQSDHGMYGIPKRQNPPRNVLRLSGGNGLGSSSTNCRRFTNVVESIGNDVTYTDDPIEGALFRINITGQYSILWRDVVAATDNMYLLRNNTATSSASFGGVTDVTLLDMSSVASGTRPSCHYNGILYAGDVIKCSFPAGGTSNSALIRFTIARMM